MGLGALLYCGRNSRRGPDIDFLDHFAARGLTAVGHPHVAFVHVKRSSLQEDLDALVVAIEKSSLVDEDDLEVKAQHRQLERVRLRLRPATEW
jgi:hypothetical protein